MIDRRVQRTIEYLRQESQRPGSLVDIATRVGLSPSRLTHLFKRHVRISIREFIQGRRLVRAAELIVTTDERISQICYAVGFTDPSNFNHAFKKEFGVTPTEYRDAALRLAKPSRDLTHISTGSTNE